MGRTTGRGRTRGIIYSQKSFDKCPTVTVFYENKKILNMNRFYAKVIIVIEMPLLV